jgi:hypothetical protein
LVRKVAVDAALADFALAWSHTIHFLSRSTIYLERHYRVR